MALRWMKCSNCHHENYANHGDSCDWGCGGVFTRVLEKPTNFPVAKLLEQIRNSDYMKARHALNATSTKNPQ